MTEIKDSAKVRQTRWLRTRGALLDATVTSLVRHGHSGTTMARIQEYAGVSRGSLTHHFGSMQELLVAAISHVAEGQLAQVTEFAEALAPDQDPDDLVGLLHRFMSGPLFVAGLELWLAARTDDALRQALVPVERNFGHRMRAALQDKGVVGPGARISRADLEMLFVLLRGLAITQILREDDTGQRRILADWAAHLRHRPIST